MIHTTKTEESKDKISQSRIKLQSQNQEVNPQRKLKKKVSVKRVEKGSSNKELGQGQF